MQVFIGGYGSCDVHNEFFILRTLFKMNNYPIVENYEDADLIILTETCVGNGLSFSTTLQYLKKLFASKKDNAKVIISGCLARGFRYNFSKYLDGYYNSSDVSVIESTNLISRVSNDYHLNDEIDPNNISSFTKLREHTIRISPVQGCLNKCSFCKVHYTKFPLKSDSYELLANNAMYIDTNKDINFLDITSSNFSLYGLDLYGKQRAHEVIRLFTEPDNIKYASVGTLINWYPELIAEIINNPKIKTIYSSLETGSPRLYAMMNRPISLAEWIRVIKQIKAARPDIVIVTEVICGYPTETLDDIKMTIDLIKELGLFLESIFPYMDYPKLIPSSKYPQHSFAYNRASARYVGNELRQLNEQIFEQIKKGEACVLKKDENNQLYYLLFTNGLEKIIKFAQLDQEYAEGDIISGDLIKPNGYLRKLARVKSN